MAKDGRDTSEHKETKSAGLVAIIGLVLGAILSIAPQFIDKLDGKSAAIAGAVLGVCAIGLKLLTTMGYVKSRTDVKIAEAISDVKETPAADTKE